MDMVLHAPRIPMSEDELAMYIQRLDCHVGKAWFTTSWPQAVAIFDSVLFETATQIETPCIESEPPCMEPAPAVETLVGGLTESTTEPESQDDSSMTDDPIWSYVSPCSTREASKSTEIRTTLVQQLGEGAR